MPGPVKHFTASEVVRRRERYFRSPLLCRLGYHKWKVKEVLEGAVFRFTIYACARPGCLAQKTTSSRV